jgi:type IV secretion system protein TrbL
VKTITRFCHRVRYSKSLLFAVLFCCLASELLAQAPPFRTTVPGDILQQFRNQRAFWIANIFVYANRLFATLALIEFAWSAAVMALDKSDMQSWASAFVRKIMWLGIFLALLLNGQNWIPAIIDSFAQIGLGAARLGDHFRPVKSSFKG